MRILTFACSWGFGCLYPFVSIGLQAVIWYHLHEYARSFSYLDTLYQSIEPIGEVALVNLPQITYADAFLFFWWSFTLSIQGTALRICLLQLDVALLSHNASRSAVSLSMLNWIWTVSKWYNRTSVCILYLSAGSIFLWGIKTNFVLYWGFLDIGKDIRTNERIKIKSIISLNYFFPFNLWFWGLHNHT